MLPRHQLHHTSLEKVYKKVSIETIKKHNQYLRHHTLHIVRHGANFGMTIFKAVFKNHNFVQHMCSVLSWWLIFQFLSSSLINHSETTLLYTCSLCFFSSCIIKKESWNENHAIFQFDNIYMKAIRSNGWGAFKSYICKIDHHHVLAYCAVFSTKRKSQL